MAVLTRSSRRGGSVCKGKPIDGRDILWGNWHHWQGHASGSFTLMLLCKRIDSLSKKRIHPWRIVVRLQSTVLEHSWSNRQEAHSSMDWDRHATMHGHPDHMVWKCLGGQIGIPWMDFLLQTCQLKLPLSCSPAPDPDSFSHATPDDNQDFEGGVRFTKVANWVDLIEQYAWNVFASIQT